MIYFYNFNYVWLICVVELLLMGVFGLGMEFVGGIIDFFDCWGGFWVYLGRLGDLFLIFILGVLGFE